MNTNIIKSSNSVTYEKITCSKCGADLANMPTKSDKYFYVCSNTKCDNSFTSDQQYPRLTFKINRDEKIVIPISGIGKIVGANE